MKKILVLAVLAVVLVAAPVMAKEGAYLGAGLYLNEIVGDDLDVFDPGIGLGLRFGYNFGSVALEGNFIRVDHSGDPGVADGTFTNLSADFKIFFSQPDDSNQFYGLVGLGVYELDLDNGNNLEGNGFNLGGGMEHYFNEQVALNLSAIYRFITYDEVNGTSIPDLDGDALSLEAGVNFYF